MDSPQNLNINEFALEFKYQWIRLRIQILMDQRSELTPNSRAGVASIDLDDTNSLNSQSRTNPKYKNFDRSMEARDQGKSIITILFIIAILIMGAFWKIELQQQQPFPNTMPIQQQANASSEVSPKNISISSIQENPIEPKFSKKQPQQSQSQPHSTQPEPQPQPQPQPKPQPDKKYSYSQTKDHVKKRFKQLQMKVQKEKANLDSLSKQKYFYQKANYYLAYLLESKFLKESQKARLAFQSSFSNMKMADQDHPLSSLAKQSEAMLHQKLSNQYHFDRFPEELPFCVVVPTYNNAPKYRYQYNLQSILNLNYSNYKVVIIDDASPDGTYNLILDLISKLSTNIKITLLKNNASRGALYAFNTAIRNHCAEEDIILTVDGDDELAGKDILKVFNVVYQERKADMVYSSCIIVVWDRDDVWKGWSRPYQAGQKAAGNYRDFNLKISQLRSFKASLFRKINEEDLKDDKGEWFQVSYDNAMLMPMLEMSCGRIQYIEQFFYIYNFGMPTNDYKRFGSKQQDTWNIIKNKKKYQCNKS